jgi:hypothetical protein
MAEEDVNQLIGGQQSSGTPLQAKSQLKVDTQSLNAMNDQFDRLLRTIKDIKKEIPDLTKQVNALVNGLSGVSTGVTGKNDSVSAAHNTLAARTAGAGITPSASQAITTGGGSFGRMRQMFAGAGGGGGGRGAALYEGATQLVGVMDRRIERGAQYSLSADRMNMLYQQMTGMSQRAVQDTYRQPLTQYRIGMQGPNQLLGMQAETGLNALTQASSVEALRAISGFSLGTGAVTSMLASLGTPEVSNRMFMMTGQSIYTFGGGQRSGMNVIQNIVTRMGLTNKRLVETGFQQGSITRERLRMSGVPEDMITTVLQYARQNIAFQERGGQGMYDPSKREHTKLMGVEDNFAVQAEETERVRMEREEQFYSRQADNFAQLEKVTQKLERAFGKLEDRLSGIIGAGTSTRSARGFLGGALQVLGGITMAGFGWTGAGAAVGAGMFSAGTVISRGGDGEFNTGTSGAAPSVSVPTTGSSGGTPRFSNFQNDPGFKKLNPRFADRLQAMMNENPNVGINIGWRSYSEQREMFVDRHNPKPKKTKSDDIFWDGRYWELAPGMDPAAPPGRSMHEIGLAADLIGDLAWVQENAGRFGLKTFAKVNGEPWHVQPAELPNSRESYEKAGSPWGTDRSAAPLDVSTDQTNGALSTSSILFGTSGMSIAETLEQAKMNTISAVLSGGLSPRGVSGSGRVAGKSGTSRGALDLSTDASGLLGADQVAQLLYEAGFRGEDLVQMLAIGGRESGYDPTAHRTDRKELQNTERATGDFGLFQINYVHYPRLQAALGLKSIHDLKDPITNAKAAFILWDGGAGAGHWAASKGGFDPNGNPLYGTNVTAARNVAASAGLLGEPTGDGSFNSGIAPQTMFSGKSSSSVMVSGGDTYNISPNITINGSSDGDLRGMARKIAQMIEEETRISAMRRR